MTRARRSVRSNRDVPQGHHRRRRLAWVLTVGIPVVLVVWGITAAVAVAQAYLDLRDARTALLVAERQVRDADLSGARDSLARGVTSAEGASTRLGRAPVRGLGWLPLAGPNLRTASAVSNAVRDVGGAAAAVLDAAHTIVHDERESVRGEVSIDYLRELVGPLRELADSLEHATSAVAAADGAGLVGPVERARTQFLDLAEPVLGEAKLAADLVEILPPFLGEDRPRRYLVGAASLSELRGSGGLIGSWSLLTADDGHLDFLEFRDIELLDDLRADVPEPEAGFAARYARRGGLRTWRNVNMTPDFPSAARTMVAMWDVLDGPVLDGVIIIDPVAYQRLVERSGPLEVPGVTTLTTDNTLRFVALDAYAAFEDDEERKAVLGAVATAAFHEIFDVLEDDDVPATVAMLADLAAGGHLRIYSTDPAIQPVLARSGVGAALPVHAGEFAAFFVTNAAANKVDAFTTRRIEHRVVLRPGGETRSSVVIEFDNGAPRDGYPRHVLGPWTPHTEAGDNLSLVSFYCGYRCNLESLPEGAKDGGRELGRPVVDIALRIPAGETRRIRYRTFTSDGWRVGDGELIVDVHHVVQPTLRASPVRVAVPVPAGWSPDAVPDDAELRAGEVVWEGEASGPISLRYTFVPVGVEAGKSAER